MQKAKRAFEPTLFLTSEFLEHSRQKTVIIGDFFESLTSDLLDVIHLSINSQQAVCPDLVSKDQKVYYESKAGTKSVKIRAEQLDYYKDFVELHFPSIDDPNPIFKVDLYFVFWFYKPVDKDVREAEILREQLANRVKACFIVPMDFVVNMGKDKTAENWCVGYKTLRNHFNEYFETSKVSKVCGIGRAIKTKRFMLYKGLEPKAQYKPQLEECVV